MDEVAAAVRTVMADPGSLTSAETEVLAAFLRAWSQHWRTSFRASLGPDGERWRDELAERCREPGRLIRLKRLAVAHLCRLL